MIQSSITATSSGLSPADPGGMQGVLPPQFAPSTDRSSRLSSALEAPAAGASIDTRFCGGAKVEVTSTRSS
ncbi:hypothetical protein GE300_11900 [Rhodobacteraceae bacterium 2CG4]|uniref:Uncharacterized protein n=1 Tax=Halovulum marinum TaxID=2662447 RepID=A0A6L5Z2U0_9RHOB|nr:hypothetical protein [Halovulum marinum]MSU90314.1 hypothetical protein [Halovulum marinum]